MKRKIFSEDHQAFRDSVRRFVKTRVVPQYPAWEEARCVPREMWREVGALGWLCPTAEERFGGLGADFLYNVVLTEELSFHGATGFFVSLHNDVVFPYLERFATDEQKGRWIPGCVSGEHVLAVAMTEPEAGSDLAALRTRAVRDGDHYVVNGSKTFISNGQIADLFVVAVRTNPDAARPHEGISLLVVEADRPGFCRGRNLDKVGFHAQDTSEVFFDDCRVPVANRLGEEGMGFRYLMENLQQERLALAIGGAAAAEGTLAVTLDYVRQRRLFGQTLSQFQNTRFEIAEIATKIQLARTFLDDLVVRHLAGESLVKEVSMAKWWVTDMQFEVADRCLQLFGGYGYMREYLVSRFWADARVQRIYGGANEVMKELIARHLDL